MLSAQGIRKNILNLPVCLLLVFLVGALTGCSHKLAPPAHFQSTPVVADGDPADWTLPLRFANAAYTIQYNITNDANNLYVCVLSRDEPTILRILRAGITLYFDPKGQSARDISLHYPLRKQPDPSIRNRNGEPLTNNGDSAWKQELVRQSDSYGITGMTGVDNGQFGVADPKSPVRVGLRLHQHDSLLVYEAVIPLTTLLGPAYRSRPPKKALSVAVVINTASGLRVASAGRYSRGRGLGLRMNGMSMGNGRRNDANTDNPAVKEDISWYQFRLAVQQ